MSEQLPSNEQPKELPKAYDPSVIEQRWADYWVSERLFDVPTPKSTQDKEEKFTILLPPPNVTGRLHMGHMLNQTEMDILTRWHRMSGDLALWIPGTDHAGIATQMMVERQLKEEGTSRIELGREAFTERVWSWRKLYGGAILDQMKRLGASVDWSREYFTMDDPPLHRGQRSLHPPLRTRPHLSWSLHRQLGPQHPDRRLRPRSRARRTPGQALSHPLPASRRPIARWNNPYHRSHHPPRDHARRHRRSRKPHRRTLHTHLIGKKSPRPTDSNQRRPRARDSHPRRRLGQTRVRHRSRQNHTRARPQRLRHRPAPQPRLTLHPRRDRTHHPLRLALRRPRPLRRPRAHRQRPRIRRPPRIHQGPHPHHRPQPAHRRSHRAAPLPPMVPRRQQKAPHRRQIHRTKRNRRRRIHQRRKTGNQLHPGDVQKDLPRVDDQHPRLVHLPPALVGTPHPRMALQILQRHNCSPRNPKNLRQLQLHRHHPGNRRPRHLVLLRSPALHHPRLARHFSP